MLFIIGSIFLFSRELRAEESPPIVITEIGAYEPSGYEWIEIFNTSEEPVDLAGWKLWENNRTYNLTLKQGDDSVIDSKEYAIITQNDVNFLEKYTHVTSTIFDSINWQTLNESGEEIGLRNAEDTIIEQFVYIAAPDFSLERINPLLKSYSDENWKEHPNANSAGVKNFWHEEMNEQEPTEEEVIQESVAPIAIVTAPTSSIISEVINFDASLSHDDGTIIDYVWDLGDTTTSSEQIISHAFSTTGTFAIFLTVTDNDGLTGTAIHEITITASSTIPIEDPEESTEEIIEEEVEEIFVVSPGNVVINEFLSNPTSGSEWIELYNNTTTTVPLHGWTMTDGTGTLVTFATDIPSLGMVILELPSHKLNNSGDIITLKNAEGISIDLVTYGNWDDGNIDDNATAPPSGRSLARSIDGEDSDEDSVDFEETTTPTKGLPNIITAPVTQQPPVQQPVQEIIPLPTFQKSDVVINELVSDPIDGQNEFIELYNNTNADINLNNWHVEDGSNTKTFLSGTVQAYSFFVLEKPKGALNNAGDLIVLFDPSNNEIDRVVYGNWNNENIELNAPVAVDPSSLARQHDGQDSDNYRTDFVTTRTVTKGKSNIITEPNRPPVINVIIPTSTLVSEFTTFDASGTADPDQDDLTFRWNFPNNITKHGDVVTYVFEKTGTFTITLTVTDSYENEATHKQKIVVIKTEDFVGGSFDRALNGLFISEMYPNPPGADDREFIELFNASTSTIDLSGLFLDDGSGGSKPYNIPIGTSIQPGEYLEFYQTETKLTLNNTSDAARILLPDLSVLSEIPYAGGKEGVSYNRHTDGTWLWSTTPTPGEEHTITLPVTKSSTTKKVSVKKTSTAQQIITANITQAKQFEKGTHVRLTGTVTTLPGVLGTQIFYIMDDTGGIQIYSYKKDFGTLAIGAQVEVIGELSESSGEARVKISDKTNIKIVGRFPRDPIQVELEHLDEEHEGALITVTGEATEIKSSSLYIDDGSAEGLVYIKKTTGIEKLDIKPGDQLTVTGILSQTKSGYRILPRAPEDIQKIIAPSITPFYQEDTDKPAIKKSSLAETYLTATAGGLTSIFFGLVAKNRGPAAANRIRQTSTAVVARLKRKK